MWSNRNSFRKVMVEQNQEVIIKIWMHAEMQCHVGSTAALTVMLPMYPWLHTSLSPHRHFTPPSLRSEKTAEG
jgi:hypothetical protein